MHIWRIDLCASTVAAKSGTEEFNVAIYTTNQGDCLKFELFAFKYMNVNYVMSSMEMLHILI